MRTRLFFAGLVLICFGAFKMNGQCLASFTYTTGAGGLVSFTSTSTGVDANTRYTWYLGNGNFLPQVADTASYTYPYNGQYHITLLVQDSGFMGSCYDSTSVNITISNALNTPCLPANFTYTVSGGQLSCTLTSPTAYNRWDFSDGINNYNTSSPTHNYTHNGTYWVTCYTQYQYGNYNIFLNCDTFYQAVPITSVPCLAQFYNDTFTIPGNGMIIHSTANGADSTFYSVNGGPYALGNIYQNGIDTFYNLPAGNNTICQKIIGNGCMDTLCQTVNVNCSIAETHTVGCGQVSFTASSNPSITSAAWYIGGTQVSTQVNPVISFTNTASFYINYNLQSSLCQKTDSVLIQVGPVPGFYLYPDTSNGPHNWIVYVNNQPNYVSYLWSWGDGTSSSTAFPTHTYASPGWYIICLTIHDNCGDSATTCQTDSVYRTSAAMVGITVHPQNISNAISIHTQEKVKVYPVPASNIITIENLPGNSRAEVYDNEGRKVMSESLSISEKRSALNIEGLAKGFYILKLYSGQDVWQKKIIKQ